MRKSFIIHFDALDVLEELSDEQAGQLFKAISEYQKTGTHDLKGIMNAVFIPFKNQFDRDSKKYQLICERNRNNGLNGGRPKETQSVILGSKNNPDKPKLTQANPKEPDNKNDNDSKNKSKKEDKNIGPPEGVSSEVWTDFKNHRKSKRSPITKTALDGIEREALKAGWTLESALSECCQRGWTGFKAEWVNKDQKGSQNGKTRSQLADEAGERALRRLEEQEADYLQLGPPVV